MFAAISRTARCGHSLIGSAPCPEDKRSDGVVALEAGCMSIWPTIAGGLSAVAVYFAGAAFIEHRRIRNRRAALKQRLLK